MTDTDTKTTANWLIALAECRGLDPAEGLALADEIEALGFSKSAHAVRRRWAARAQPAPAQVVAITSDGDWLVVQTPYKPRFADDLKTVVRPARRSWDPAAKAWRVHTGQKVLLWGLLQHHYPGHRANGPKGPFTI